VVTLPAFVAHIEFRFDAADLEATNSRLHELMRAADAVGFSFVRSRVEEAPSEEEDSTGWTGYGPTASS